MIFVTVGTHEQQFNRLIKCVDELKKDGIIDEDVVIQTGYSTYEPSNCIWKKLYSYDEMNSFINKARIVITHGGPSSFVPVLKNEKIPIVAPRKAEFGEHINDHQLVFARKVKERYKNIIIIEDIAELQKVLADYDLVTADMNAQVHSNNKLFNKKLEQIIEKLFNIA